MRNKTVKTIIVEFDDGTEERWTFPPPLRAYYHEHLNSNTERNPIKEVWHEHRVQWTSGRMRAIK